MVGAIYNFVMYLRMLAVYFMHIRTSLHDAHNTFGVFVCSDTYSKVLSTSHGPITKFALIMHLSESYVS